MRRFGDNLAKGVGDERATPELQAFAGSLIAANISRLEADAIRHRDVHSVGDGVGALDGAPRVVLRVTVFRLLVWVPANCGGIEQHVGALRSREPRAFWIPLVPAHQRAELSEVRLERFEAEIARCEVKLFVIERVVRYVHLAIHAVELAAGIDDGRSVVVETGRPPLKQRRNDRGFQLACDLAQPFGRRSRNRFRQIEQRGVFPLAEVLGEKELRQADELRTLLRRLAHVFDGAVKIGVRIRRARHLHDTDSEVFFCQNSSPARNELTSIASDSGARRHAG